VYTGIPDRIYLKKLPIESPVTTPILHSDASSHKPSTPEAFFVSIRLSVLQNRNNKAIIPLKVDYITQ
jgi:hypothetical protein